MILVKRKNIFSALVICLFSILFIFSFFTSREERAITTFSENKIKTVIIDAGHGGEDGGAVSINGILEKDINLQISKKLEHLFNLFGVNTEMTRRDDSSLGENSSELIRNRKAMDIRKRVEIINNIPDALLVSIHQNSFPQENCKGAQVFYSEKNGESKLVAEFLQEEFRSVINNNNLRKAKTDSSIYILNNVNCPAILVECGFLTNKEEAGLLTTENYQKKISLCLAGAIIKNLY